MVDDINLVSNSTFDSSVARSNELKHQIEKNPKNFKVLTGERPTGKLHIGHLFGSIQERVKFQNIGTETSIIIADYQVITDRDELKDLQSNVRDIIIDNLAAGLDPEKTMMFCHSQIPPLNQLMLPFLSLVSNAELLRNPTVKSEMESSGRELSGLLLTYPVHQAADILFCKGNIVPVGKDQLPHIELCRTIAKRFNSRYCSVDYSRLDKNGQPLGIENAVFPEPEALLSEVPHVPGLDGRKMSKSFDNAIMLSMTEDETASVIKKSETDSERTIFYDFENRPGVSSLLTITALCRGLRIDSASDFAGQKQVADEINSDPKYGSGLLKAKAIESVNEYLKTHRQKRRELAANLDYIDSILKNGNLKALEIASQTLGEVQSAMGTCY